MLPRRRLFLPSLTLSFPIWRYKLLRTVLLSCPELPTVLLRSFLHCAHRWCGRAPLEERGQAEWLELETRSPREAHTAGMGVRGAPKKKCDKKKGKKNRKAQSILEKPAVSHSMRFSCEPGLSAVARAGPPFSWVPSLSVGAFRWDGSV